MPHAPLISIVTPCRDAAAFLPRALESVVRSAAELASGEVEHIIVDGASTDGTVDLIRRYAEAHPRLVTHWLSQPDQGQSDAINRGMAMARGRFATWLNADDWYEPGGLETIAGRLREESPDVVAGLCRFVDGAGRTVWEPRPPRPIALADLLSLRSVWFNGQSLVQPEVFFQRELFQKCGGLNIARHYAMDHELWCRMLLAGACFEHVDVLVANAGVHAAQKTQNNREVVRELLGYVVPLARASNGVLGDRAEQVTAELHAMSKKLEVADATIRWWRRSLDLADSERKPAAPEQQPSPPVAGDKVRARAIAAAARALWWRGRVRVGFYECDPHIVVEVVKALGSRKSLEVHAASSSRLSIAQASAAVRSLRSSKVTMTGHLGMLVAGPFDLLVVHGLSARAAAPISTFGGLWSRLGPRGVILQLDDPVMNADVQRYIDLLTTRLGENLSKNDDVILTEDADKFLGSVDAHHSRPIVTGLDMRDVVGRLCPGSHCLYERAYGGPQDHPLTPFSPVGVGAARSFESWSSSAWRRRV